MSRLPPLSYVQCNVYIDGQYVRRQLRDQSLIDEFDPTIMEQYVWNEQLGKRPFLAVRFFYYDAINEHASEDERKKQRDYLQRVERLKDTTVRTGYVRIRNKQRHQKAVDIQLAVDALEAAQSGVLEAVALVAGDGDFAPLVEAIQRAGPHAVVMGFEGHISDELRDVADRVVLLPANPGNDWDLRPGVVRQWP